ncbi:hypothetical protein V2J09_006982 [Rumex salicifolius]
MGYHDRSGEMDKKMTEYKELSRSVTKENRRYGISSMDVHPTKPLILMTWWMGSLGIWDFRSKKLHMDFDMSEYHHECAKFIARKDWAVAGLRSKCIAVYNYSSRKRIARFEAHTSRLTSVAVHPTLPYVLSSSEDELIKLWDWDNGWACTRIFQAKCSYVMDVTFNPKDPNTFASANHDGTIKVWNLGSSDPDFSLDAHENRVNCVDYYTGNDKPWLISCSRDRTAKVWDYETRTCVGILEGHETWVITASFHPQLPIIVTGSAYGTVRYWNSITYRVAIGYSSVLIVVKLGGDRPVACMDHKSGEILWAKHEEIQIADIRHDQADYKATDGERLSLATVGCIPSNIYPQYMKQSPRGRCVVIGGDGEYVILKRDAAARCGWEYIYGYALEFVWSSDGEYALRETTSNIKVKMSYEPVFPAERIFGGTLLAICCSQFICFFDWENCYFIHRIDIVGVKDLYWAATGNLVAITTDTSLFVYKYQHEKDAFELLHETNERVTTGLWVNYNCFIYVNSSWRLNYCVGDEVTTFFYLDRPMYLLGYLAARSRVYLFDMEFNVVGCTLPLSLIKFKRLVMSRNIKIANAIVPNIPIKHRDSAARFLESKGMLEDALNVATNPDYRFELAIQLGRLEIAKATTSETESESKWKRLGELSMSAGKVLA